MKIKPGWERPSKTVTFSCPPETELFLKERVRELKPIVANRSHYLMRLIEADRSGESAVFPKDDSQLLLDGSTTFEYGEDWIGRHYKCNCGVTVSLTKPEEKKLDVVPPDVLEMIKEREARKSNRVYPSLEIAFG